jgi:succinate dehydrogenase hydrophobic anchor subunit
MTRISVRPRTVRPSWSFEYIMWFFTRVSGLGMYLLALAGLIMALVYGARTQVDLVTLMRWIFFPNRFHVESYLGDSTLWVTTTWQIMQSLILFFAVTHGFNGLRVVIEDTVGHTIWRPLLRGALFLGWLTMLLVALLVAWQA